MMRTTLIIRQGMMSCRGARRRERRTILMMMMILMIRQGMMSCRGGGRGLY